jgi:hypothetical protein
MAGNKLLSEGKERNATPNPRRKATRLRGRSAQAKKARYGSGLNLSLEENRGDRCIMLHCKIKSQFKFPMTVIDGLNSTAEAD